MIIVHQMIEYYYLVRIVRIRPYDDNDLSERIFSYRHSSIDFEFDCTSNVGFCSTQLYSYIYDIIINRKTCLRQ